MNKGRGMNRRALLGIPMALLLQAALVWGPSAGPAQAHPSTFPDVAENHPAFNAIEDLASRGIVSGYPDGDFQPGRAVNRGQAAKILVVWRGLSSPSTDSPFPDVAPEASAWVAAASRAGWVNGFPDGTFRPYQHLTRQQMAVVIGRSLHFEEQDGTADEARVASLLSRFSDQAAISPAARPYVALATERGLFLGDGGRFDPGAPVTRAQFCLVVHRADRLMRGEDPAPLPPVGESVAREAEMTPQQKARAAFMDACLFRPRNSPVTGAMVIQNEEWYGIPAVSQLVIMAAETSLGDPKLGGALARHYNFGCLRYHGSNTAWGELASGRVWVAGKDWYSFPSAQIGMVAFGRYLKVGVNGFYLPILSSPQPDWRRFAAVYYGRNVSGFERYVSRLYSIERRFRSMAAENGVTL